MMIVNKKCCFSSEFDFCENLKNDCSEKKKDVPEIFDQFDSLLQIFEERYFDSLDLFTRRICFVSGNRCVLGFHLCGHFKR